MGLRFRPRWLRGTRPWWLLAALTLAVPGLVMGSVWLLGHQALTGCRAGIAHDHTVGEDAAHDHGHEGEAPDAHGDDHEHDEAGALKLSQAAQETVECAWRRWNSARSRGPSPCPP